MASDSITYHNPTEHIIRLGMLDLPDVPPKGDVEVPLHLAAPGRTDNGARGKSSIEQVAPQLQPKSPKDQALLGQVPAESPRESKIVTVARREVREAPGVAALRAARKAAESDD